MSKYTIKGVVKNSEDKKGILDLHVIAYCKMPKVEPNTESEEERKKKIHKVPKHRATHDFMAIGVTDATGNFSLSFDYSKPRIPFWGELDLFLVVKDGGQELPIMKDKKTVIKGNVLKIENVTKSTRFIDISVYLPDSSLRKQVKKEAADGKEKDKEWVGGFNKTNPDFLYTDPYYISLGKENRKLYDYPNPELKFVNGKVLKPIYPNPDLSSLGDLKDNLMNIHLLDRQQKVLWAEFSWKSRPCRVDDAKLKDIVPKNQNDVKVAQNRCYKMFSPDISRLGYDKEGRVYSIICPQQGTYISGLGTMNLEVTVTGNRGWADESTKELAADIGVEAKIWFSPKGSFLRKLVTKVEKDMLGEEYSFFPSSKEKAIRIRTFRPGFPDQPVFPLKKGPCKEFELPAFTKHEEISWDSGHLGVGIGSPIKTGCSKIDKFNQTLLDLFNANAGNMLKENNVLTWNVWFTAPEIVDEQEWRDHADKWRQSVDANHDAPGGSGTIPRYLDGTPLKVSKVALAKKMLLVIFYVIQFYIKRTVLKLLKYGIIIGAINYMLSAILFLIMILVLLYMMVFVF